MRGWTSGANVCLPTFEGLDRPIADISGSLVAVGEVARSGCARQRDGRSVASMVVDAVRTITGAVEPASAIDWV